MMPPRPTPREQPVPALKPSRIPMRPQQLRIDSAYSGRAAESMQSESDLRDQAIPPRRPGLSPVAHGTKSPIPSRAVGMTKEEKVLVRWELFRHPALGPIPVPGNSALAQEAWDWASSLGGESPRWKRFLRVVRVRARAYRIAGARGDVTIKAMGDVALALRAVSPERSALV